MDGRRRVWSCAPPRSRADRPGAEPGRPPRSSHNAHELPGRSALMSGLVALATILLTSSGPSMRSGAPWSCWSDHNVKIRRRRAEIPDAVVALATLTSGSRAPPRSFSTLWRVPARAQLRAATFPNAPRWGRCCPE